MLLVRFTPRPFAGAIPLSVTVPVDASPNPTVPGLNESMLTTAGFTVSVAALLLDPSVAVTVMFFTPETPAVTTTNVCVVLPAGTVTFAGRDTEGSELASVTIAPPAGAAELSVTLPIEPAPPVTEFGTKLTDASPRVTDRFTVSVPAAVVVPVVATTMAISELPTAAVVTEKVCVVAPAGTVTLAGTGTAVELLVSATGYPLEGAGAFSVRVPDDVWPAVTLAGLNANAATAGGSRVSVVVFVDPLSAAPMVSARGFPTAVVVIVKLALVVPPGTVTVAGTCADALFVLSTIGAPPAAAADASTTVAVVERPPVTVIGARLNAVICGDATTRTAVAVVFRVALIVTLAEAFTAFVLIVKFTFDCPAGTVIFEAANEVRAALLVASVTESPPVGAALDSTTVPVQALPPATS